MTTRKSRKTTAGSVFNASGYPATEASRDAAWEHFERLRDTSRSAGLDEEELFGCLGESAHSRGFLHLPNPSCQSS